MEVEDIYNPPPPTHTLGGTRVKPLVPPVSDPSKTLLVEVLRLAVSDLTDPRATAEERADSVDYFTDDSNGFFRATCQELHARPEVIRGVVSKKTGIEL